MGNLPRVVVTGIGAETALGHGVSALWEGALLGRSAIRPVARFDTDRFHARQAALIDAATAHPAKFPEIVEGAIQTTIPLPEALKEALGRTKVSTPIRPIYGEWKEALLSS